MCSSFTDGKNHPVLFAGAGLFAINVFRTSAGLTKASVFAVCLAISVIRPQHFRVLVTEYPVYVAGRIGNQWQCLRTHPYRQD